MKPIIKVEIVGKPNFTKIDRLTEAIRKFYANPENVRAFNEWKKAGAMI